MQGYGFSTCLFIIAHRSKIDIKMESTIATEIASERASLVF